MKILAGLPNPNHRQAFTLAELLIASGLFVVIVAGMLCCHVLGLKMSILTQTKLTATHNARAALNMARDEIRAATTLYVGSGGNGGFTNLATNSPHVGNALQIYPTENTNDFIRYFVDASDQTLRRKESGVTNSQVIARYITNELAFQAEDYAGNVLTNDQNNRVIKVSLEFNQYQFASLQTAGKKFYDYYKLQTKVARRARE